MKLPKLSYLFVKLKMTMRHWKNKMDVKSKMSSTVELLVDPFKHTSKGCLSNLSLHIMRQCCQSTLNLNTNKPFYALNSLPAFLTHS